LTADAESVSSPDIALEPRYRAHYQPSGRSWRANGKSIAILAVNPFQGLSRGEFKSGGRLGLNDFKSIALE
jgi:hypothetical protein